MEVKRLTGVFGAEIILDDVRHLDDWQVAELRALVCEHEVVVVRGQSLDVDEQVALSRRFGPAGPVPFIESSPDHPEVIKVLKEAADGGAFNFGGAWHSDFSFQPEPPSFTVLRAVDLPPWGGDTVFASMTAAWRTLGPQMQDTLRPLRAVHTARDAYSRRMQPLHSGMRGMNIVCDDSANDEQIHPLVTTHPETGRTVLFFNRAYVRDIADMESGEAAELLDFLHQHTTDVRFQYRHRWRSGDVVIWDNRSTQHFAINDYAGFRRELHRTTIKGTVPSS